MMENIYIADKSLDELLELFQCNIKNDDDFFDVIAFNIVKTDSEYLLNIIDQFDKNRQRAAIFGLSFATPSHKLLEKLKAFIKHEDESDTVKAESIDALRRLNQVEKWSLIKEFQNHKSHFVRGAVLRFASAAFGEDALDMLLAALNDKHSIVRENAIDELAELGIKSAISHIQNLLNDENENVRLAAKSAIDEISK